MYKRKLVHNYRGLTLTELMVSLAVLTIIVLVVNQLMVSVREAVRVSQAAIRAEADTRVVFRRIRDDLATLSQDGFLAIVHRDVEYTRDSNVPSPGTHVLVAPHLIFTAIRPSRSLVSTTATNAALVQYGLTSFGHTVDVAGTEGDLADDTHLHVMFRRALLLDPAAPEPKPGDVWRWSFSTFRKDGGDTFWRLNSWIHEGGGFAEPPEVVLPPRTAEEIQGTWPVVIDSINAHPNTDGGGYRYWRNPGFSIEWTDGETDATGALIWYGPENPRDGNWESKVLYDAGTGQPVYDESGYPSKNYPEHVPYLQASQRPAPSLPLYQAIWTYRNKSNWPAALRVRLRIGMPARECESIIFLGP
jgi:prepilin-type N-terminal cleavage/methylation domain-containing protein